MNDVQPVINVPFNIDTTIEAFKVSNSHKDKYLRIVGGQAQTIADPEQASSMEAIDQFVQKNCLNTDFSFEKQILLIQQLQIFYQALQNTDPLLAKKYTKVFDKALPAPDLQAKKTEFFKVIAQTSDKIDKSAKFLQNLPNLKAEHEAHRKQTLNLNYALAYMNSQASLSKINLPEQAFNLALRNAPHTAEISDLSRDFEGQFSLESARTRASYAISLLNKIVIDGNYPEGIKTKEEIDDLIKICQNRLTVYNYANGLNKVHHKTISSKKIITNIQKHIDLLENPSSDTVTHLKDNSSSFTFPGGWYAHYVSYRFIKKGNEYFFEIHNKGSQVTDERLHGKIKFSDPKTNKEYRKTTVRIKTTKDALKDPKLLKILIEANNRRGALAYNKIYDFFIKPPPNAYIFNPKIAPRGTLVESETEKRLKELELDLLEFDPEEYDNRVVKALALVKNGDKYFRSCQLYGTCTESNYLTTEEDIASPSVRKSLETYTLAHMTEKLAGPLLIEKYKEKEANLTNLRQHVSQRVDKLKRILKAIPPSIAPPIANKPDYPTIIHKLIPKKSFTENELKQFIDLFKSGKLEFRLLPKMIKNQPAIALAHIEKYPLALQELSPELKDNETIVLAAVKRNGLALQYASDRIKGILAIVLASKEQNSLAVKFASDKLTLDQVFTKAEKMKFIKKIEKGIVRIEAKEGGRALSKIFLEDRDVILAAVRFDGLALKGAPSRFQEDIEVVKASKNQNFLALEYASTKIKLDDILTIREKQNLLNSLKNGTLKLDSLPKFLRNDPDIVLAAVQKDGLSLQFASEKLQGNLKIVLAAKKQNFKALNYASDQLKIEKVLTNEEKRKIVDSLKNGTLTLDVVPKICRNNTEMVLAAVEKDPLSLKFASKALRSDYDISVKAVEKDGMALKYVVKSAKDFNAIAQYAVNQNGLALQYVDEKYVNKDDYATCIQIASAENIEALQLASKNCHTLTGDSEFISSCLEQDITSIKYFPYMSDEVIKDTMELIFTGLKDKIIQFKDLPISLKDNFDFVLKVVKNNGLDLRFASEVLQSNEHIVLAAMKQNIKALEYASEDLPCEIILEEKNAIFTGLIEGNLIFQSLPNELKDDKAIVLAALKKDASFFQSLPDKFRGDVDVVMAVMKLDITNLNYIVKDTFKNQKLAKNQTLYNRILLAQIPIIDAIKKGKLNIQSLPIFNKEMALEAIKQDPANLQYVLKYLVEEPPLANSTPAEQNAFVKTILDIFITQLDKEVISIENLIIPFVLSGKFAFPDINKLIKEKLILSFVDDPQAVVKAWAGQSSYVNSSPLQALISEFLSYRLPETYLKIVPASLQKQFFDKCKELANTSPFAQLNLGFCFQNGFGVDVDKKRAFEAIKLAAEAGNIQAQIGVANAYRDGSGVAKHKKAAFKIYKKLADKGNAEAQLNLAMCFKVGLGVEPNPVASLQLLQLSAKQGYPYALFQLGLAYQEGSGVVKSLVKAFECFEKAAVFGNPKHQLKVAQCYLKGLGVQQDAKKAFPLIKKSADQGDASATNLLAICYEKGIGVKANKVKASETYLQAALNFDALNPQNASLILKCIHDAIRLGNVAAQVELGIMYEKGLIDNKVNIPKAIELYTEASAQGNKKANIQLGRIHEFGIGVPINIEKAIDFYMQGGELGADIELRIADYYDEGTGVEVDHVKAYYFYVLAAEHGSASADYNAGRYHYEGKIIKQDLESAIKFWSKPSLTDNGLANQGLAHIYDGENDVQKAGEYYLKAGNFFAEGNSETEKNLNSAIYCYENASDCEIAEAKIKLGLLHEKGMVDGTIDLETAFELYQEADNCLVRKKYFSDPMRDIANKHMERIFNDITIKKAL